MNKINFFAAAIYRESSRTDNLFGINDSIQEADHNGMAYTTTAEEVKWNATVKNEDKMTVTFEPLDHNLDVKDEDGNQYSLCDGMLFTSDNKILSFIELKVQRKEWLTKNVSQLASTIGLFNANHYYKQWKKRTAYAANSRHPEFMYSHRTMMQDFRNRTHFSLRIVATIEIK